MSYRVFWFPDAQRFIDLLLEASEDGAKIAKASQEIDRRLTNDSFDFGESRDGQRRIGFESPLAITFEILRDVSTVIVHDVWQPWKKR